MLSWEFQRKRYNELKTFKTSIDDSEIPVDFRKYFIDYLKSNILTKPERAYQIRHEHKSFWEFIKNKKIKNFHQLERFNYEWKLFMKEKFPNENTRRKTKGIILGFCEFCHQRDKDFAPSKIVFYKTHVSKYHPKTKILFKDLYGEDFELNFALIPFKIENQYLDYVNYRKRKGYVAKTIYGEHRVMKHLSNFMFHNRLDKIEDFTSSDVTNYVNYVKTLKNHRTNEILSARSQQFIYHTNRSFVRYLASIDNKYIEILNYFDEYNITSSEELSTQSISEDILHQIKKEIKSCKDIYLKPMLILLLTYGMRRTDILHLRIDCLQPNENDSKRYDLKYKNIKSNKYQTIYSVNPSLILPIKELIEYTKPLREKSNLDYLFLTINNSYKRLNEIDLLQEGAVGSKINRFIKEHNIKDSNGQYAKVSPHMFRRTIPEIYEKKGISLQTAQTVLGHKRISTTDKHYNRTNEYEYEKTIKIAIENMVYLKEPTKAEIKTLFSSTDAYKIIEEGYCKSSTAYTSSSICEHLQSRGNCYGCHQMITTPEYIPFFKNQLNVWKNEVKKLEYLGEHVTRHFKWKIKVVKGIIKKLEEIQNDNS